MKEILSIVVTLVYYNLTSPNTREYYEVYKIVAMVQ